MEKKRIAYLDMVKGIGIILVVAGHSTYLPEQAITWLASFHMPLFFIVSGMLIWQLGQETKPLGQCIRHKAKGILIPYVSFSLIWILIQSLCLVASKDSITTEQIIEGIYQIVTFHGVSTLWFLPVLFVSEGMFLGLRKIKSGKEIVTVGSILTFGMLAVALKPVIDQIQMIGIRYLSYMFLRSFVAVVFIAVGYYIKKHIMKDREKHSPIELILGMGLCAVVVYLSFIGPRVDMSYLVLGNPFLYYGRAIMGTMGIVLICKNVPVITALTYFGKNSLIIMGTHLECRIVLITMLLASTMSRLSPRAKVYVLYGSFILFFIVIEMIVIYIFNHYLYFLIGKKKSCNK